MSLYHLSVVYSPIVCLSEGEGQGKGSIHLISDAPFFGLVEVKC